MNAPICTQIQSYKKYSKIQLCQPNMSTDVFLQDLCHIVLLLAILGI